MAMTVYSQGLPDESCSQHFGQYGRWRCYLGQYSVPFVEATSLILQNQIDEWQGFWNGFFNYTQDNDSFDYATWFRARSQATLRAAASGTNRDSVHIFSPNCYHHGLAYDSIFWEVKVDGWSSSTMLQSLLEQPTGSLAVTPHMVIDTCDGLPCSPGTVGHADCLSVIPPLQT
jgi:hypothetical protein